MTLDILSERGKETVAQELRAVEIIRSNWPACDYFHTAKDAPGAVDGVLCMWPLVKAVAENKCRNMSLHQLKTTFGNEWLVTHQKILDGRQVARLLCVEFWGFLYLVPDDIVLRVKLSAPGSDDWLVRVRVLNTETQRTVNGGKVRRDNAYIDMTTADVLQERIVVDEAHGRDDGPDE